jgi:hypothetical protein
MKQITTAIFIILMGSNAKAQFTKGGSEKNYDNYHLVYDTITTTEKISIPFQNYRFTYLSIAPAFPVGKGNDLPSNFWDKWNTNGNWNYPFESGEIGLKTGFNFKFGRFKGIDFINKELIPELELGIEQNLAFSTMKLDWTPLIKSIPVSYSNEHRNMYTSLINRMSKSFFTLGYGIGLGMTYHTPVKDLDVRLAYLATFNYISPVNLDVSSESSFTNTGSSQELSTSLIQDDVGSISLFSQIKIHALYKLGFLGISFHNQMRPIDKYMSASYTFTGNPSDPNQTGPIAGGWSRSFNSSFKLSHITLDIGLKL